MSFQSQGIDCERQICNQIFLTSDQSLSILKRFQRNNLFAILRPNIMKDNNFLVFMPPTQNETSLNEASP